MAHLAAQIILPVIIAMLYLLGAAVQAALLRVSTPASCSTRGWAPPPAGDQGGGVTSG